MFHATMHEVDVIRERPLALVAPGRLRIKANERGSHWEAWDCLRSRVSPREPLLCQQCGGNYAPLNGTDQYSESSGTPSVVTH